jgi:hypothetical protein
VANEYSIILGYVVFVGFLALLVGYAGESLFENAPSAPVFPTEATSWDYLLFPLSNLAYFFGLMGLTAITYPILGIVLFGYSIVFLYIVMGLIRGGH